MTEKTIKALDDFVTREIKKLGVDVGRHSFLSARDHTQDGKTKTFSGLTRENIFNS